MTPCERKFANCCPDEGTIENSPAFQRWVTYPTGTSPEGTAESRWQMCSVVPSGLEWDRQCPRR